MEASFRPGSAFEAETVEDVESHMAKLCEQLGAGGSAVDTAMSRFIADFFILVRSKGSQRAVKGMITLPFLVHGAETGDPVPARPIAMIHLLWWAAARYLDDLVDASGAQQPGHTEVNKQLLTALGVGSHLPIRMITGLPVSADVRERLCAEVSRCWLDGISGQLQDLSATPESATPESVLHSYAGKTGSPYAMAAAMAACLAGASEERVTAWRDFGRTFGALRQLVNDQRDLVTGRHEDLANGTATYLLVHLLWSLPAQRRAQVLRLHAEAAHSEQARLTLSRWMLERGTIEGYAHAIAPTIRQALDSLESLRGNDSFIAGLHGLVEETLSFFPEFRLATV